MLATEIVQEPIRAGSEDPPPKQAQEAAAETERAELQVAAQQILPVPGVRGPSFNVQPSECPEWCAHSLAVSWAPGTSL